MALGDLFTWIVGLVTPRLGGWGDVSNDICVHGMWDDNHSHCECTGNWTTDVNQDPFSGDLFVWCNSSLSFPNGTTSAATKSTMDTKNLIIIIVMAVAGVAALGTAVYCCCCRKRKKERQAEEQRNARVRSRDDSAAFAPNHAAQSYQEARAQQPPEAASAPAAAARAKRTVTPLSSTSIVGNAGHTSAGIPVAPLQPSALSAHSQSYILITPQQLMGLSTASPQSFLTHPTVTTTTSGMLQPLAQSHLRALHNSVFVPMDMSVAGQQPQAPQRAVRESTTASLRRRHQRDQRDQQRQRHQQRLPRQRRPSAAFHPLGQGGFPGTATRSPSASLLRSQPLPEGISSVLHASSPAARSVSQPRRSLMGEHLWDSEASLLSAHTESVGTVSDTASSGGDEYAAGDMFYDPDTGNYFVCTAREADGTAEVEDDDDGNERGIRENDHEASWQDDVDSHIVDFVTVQQREQVGRRGPRSQRTTASDRDGEHMRSGSVRAVPHRRRPTSSSLQHYQFPPRSTSAAPAARRTYCRNDRDSRRASCAYGRGSAGNEPSSQHEPFA